MAEETPLDKAHAAMQAAPDDDRARLRFYERVADAELFVLLESEPQGDQITPELMERDGESYLLGFDRAARLAAYQEASPYVALSGRAVAQMLEGQGIGIVAIMSNDYENYPDDSPENMKKFAAQYGMSFPYLVDVTQEVAKAYDAVCTPDFFGFNANKELQYRGRLDDLKMGGVGERTPELLEAMQQIAATGTGPENQTPSMGCSIKWK